jgi:hypothetical protein
VHYFFEQNKETEEDGKEVLSATLAFSLHRQRVPGSGQHSQFLRNTLSSFLVTQAKQLQKASV